MDIQLFDFNMPGVKFHVPSEDISLSINISDDTLDDVIKALRTLTDVFSAIRDGKESTHVLGSGDWVRSKYGVMFEDADGKYSFPGEHIEYSCKWSNHRSTAKYSGCVVEGCEYCDGKMMFQTLREFGEFMRDGKHTFNEFVREELQRLMGKRK